ncbi:MAG: type II toxin-antitoxin system HicA family toxin [Planctomycetota bacterium]
MPPFRPMKRRELIQYLRKDGFLGPLPGGKHEYMVKENVRVILPNPHVSDIGRALLARILRQAAINREEWEEL